MSIHETTFRSILYLSHSSSTHFSLSIKKNNEGRGGYEWFTMSIHETTFRSILYLSHSSSTHFLFIYQNIMKDVSPSFTPLNLYFLFFIFTTLPPSFSHPHILTSSHPHLYTTPNLTKYTQV
jgi:hypothetical protein